MSIYKNILIFNIINFVVVGNPCYKYTLRHTKCLGGDIMTKKFWKLIKLIFKKIQKKKQPTVKAVNSNVTLIIINKD